MDSIGVTVYSQEYKQSYGYTLDSIENFSNALPPADAAMLDLYLSGALFSTRYADYITRTTTEGFTEMVWSMPRGGGTINGRRFSEHALERMAPDTIEVRAELTTRATEKAIERGLQRGTVDFENFLKKYVDPRGITPTVVEDAIQNTTAQAGKYDGTFIHQNDNVTVVVNSDGDVITVIPK